MIANTLTNTTEYKARIRTYASNGITYSQWSDWIVFWCFENPIVTITNIIDGTINNQTYTFTGSYTHSDNLQSYRYLLYDNNQTLIQSYSEIFDLLLEQEVAGLENGIKYYIELKTISIHEMSGTSGLIEFIPNYIQPRLSTVLSLENLSNQAAIKVTANVIQIIFEILEGIISYIDNDLVDLTNATIYAQEGFDISNNFTLKIWCKSLPVDESFLILYGEQGNIELKYYNSKIHLIKNINTSSVQYHIASNEINPLDTDLIAIVVQYINNLFDIKCDIIV